MREYANTAGMSSDLRNESAGCNGLICAAVIVVWMGGIRVVAIQPIGAIPEGVTAVVSGVRKIRLVDSPDAICAREHGGVSLICRGATAAAIVRQGKILFRLHYGDTLFRMTGGPWRPD